MQFNLALVHTSLHICLITMNIIAYKRYTLNNYGCFNLTQCLIYHVTPDKYPPEKLLKKGSLVEIFLGTAGLE